MSLWGKVYLSLRNGVLYMPAWVTSWRACMGGMLVWVAWVACYVGWCGWRVCVGGMLVWVAWVVCLRGWHATVLAWYAWVDVLTWVTWLTS